MINAIPIHVINLPHRTDRKAKIIEELARVKLTNYTFTEAIHGSTLDVEAMEKAGEISFKCRKLKRGEYGCYLSHLDVYKKIITSNEEMHLILEDDVFFVPSFKVKANTLLSKVAKIEWDILYLGVNNWNETHHQGTFVQEGIYCPANPIWGTHAYVIKKSTLERIIDLLMPIILPIDVKLMEMTEIKKLVLTNNIVRNHNSESDTQSIK